MSHSTKVCVHLLSQFLVFNIMPMEALLACNKIIIFVIIIYSLEDLDPCCTELLIMGYT